MRRRALLLAVSALALGGPLPGCRSGDPRIDTDLVAEDRWADLAAQLDRRLALVATLVATLKAGADRDDDALTRLAEARSRAHLEMTGDDLTDPMKVAALVKAGEALRREVARVLALGQRPAGDGALRDLAAQLADVDASIARASEAYDSAARDYDAALARVPGDAVNTLTGRRFRPRVILAAAASAGP